MAVHHDPLSLNAWRHSARHIFTDLAYWAGGQKSADVVRDEAWLVAAHGKGGRLIECTSIGVGE
jgi:hypothetical protein